MKRSMSPLGVVLLPLALLCAGILAERTLAPEPNASSAPVLALGDHKESNPERAVLETLVRRLTRSPGQPVTLAWREMVGGVGMVDRRVTYFPADRRLVDVTMDQTMIHNGVTVAGMRKALQNGERTATFACAQVASAAPVPKESPIAEAPHLPPAAAGVPHHNGAIFNAKLTGT